MSGVSQVSPCYREEMEREFTFASVRSARLLAELLPRLGNAQAYSPVKGRGPGYGLIPKLVGYSTHELINSDSRIHHQR